MAIEPLGYATGLGGKNPDGSYFCKGEAVYKADGWGVVSENFLIRRYFPDISLPKTLPKSQNVNTNIAINVEEIFD
jgi:hypothetical protein